MTAPGYTVRWAAPEVLDGELPTLASDIWSLGWICWEVLTGKLPFDNISKDQDVIIKVMGGELPGLHESLARNTGTLEFSTQDHVKSLCTFMETCWAIAPHRRPGSRDLMHVQRLVHFDVTEYSSHWTGDLIEAASEIHIIEGRLGKALQYIQAYRRWHGQRRGREPTAITFLKMLDRCRRSTSGAETVHEEEAARSWNLALNCFAGQLYLEAERHIIDAALLYEVLGFEKQVLDCAQFLGVLEGEAMGISPRNPAEAARYIKGFPRSLFTRPEMLQGPRPTFQDDMFEFEKERAEMIWLVVGALQHASSSPLSAEKIAFLIKKYHPGKLRQYWESFAGSGEGSGTEYIEHILRSSEVFEGVSCYWRLGSLAHLPPFPLIQGELRLDEYFTSLGSPEKFQVHR